MNQSYLDCPNVRVLGSIFVLIQAVFSEFSFLQFDAEFHKKHHHRLEGRDGAIPGSLGCNMFIENRESSRGLINCDEFLRSLRVDDWLANGHFYMCMKQLTLSTFSGFV